MLESVTDQGVRMGKLLWGTSGKIPANSAIGSHPQPVHQALTPLCLLYSRGGSIPHLTPDILEGVVTVPRSKVIPKGQGATDTEGRTVLLTLPTLYVYNVTILFLTYGIQVQITEFYMYASGIMIAVFKDCMTQVSKFSFS